MDQSIMTPNAEGMVFSVLGTVNYGASGYDSGDASGDASLL